jgi:hypothetical protein
VNNVADVVLSIKGQVSDGIFRRQKAVVSETDSATLALAEALARAKVQISQLYFDRLGSSFDTLESKLDSLPPIAYFRGDGRVGLGTEDPLERLDVRGTILAQYVQLRRHTGEIGGELKQETKWFTIRGNPETNDGGSLHVGDDQTNRSIIMTPRSSDENSAVMILKPTYDTVRPIAWFRGDGRVGNNTCAPEAKLHVHGSALFETDTVMRIVFNPPADNGLVIESDNDGATMQASNDGSGPALVASGSGRGPAGVFYGDVEVYGTFSATNYDTINPPASCKIDHPLDPENMYLSHSVVGGPDMMNVYNGNVILGANGEAEVKLPDYFESLNRDYRCQLTAIGAPVPDLHVAEEVSGNRFRIAGGAAGMKVSWQVTGIRQDESANAHRIEVEEDKIPSQQGKYLHPDAYGMPESMGVNHEPEAENLSDGR